MLKYKTRSYHRLSIKDRKKELALHSRNKEKILLLNPIVRTNRMWVEFSVEMIKDLDLKIKENLKFPIIKVMKRMYGTLTLLMSNCHLFKKRRLGAKLFSKVLMIRIKTFIKACWNTSWNGALGLVKTKQLIRSFWVGENQSWILLLLRQIRLSKLVMQNRISRQLMRIWILLRCSRCRVIRVLPGLLISFRLLMLISRKLESFLIYFRIRHLMLLNRISQRSKLLTKKKVWSISICKK